MIGSFLTRGLVMVFGYAYPAYECYKTVERNKPEIEQLRFWCQYWILVAVLTVCERVGDAFVSWVPMYSEAKLAFFIYLWYPKTKGTTYVYHSFFQPYIAKHENDIDQNLLEMRTRAGDLAVLYWQRAASYGQTRVLDILQYIAAQSTPRPQSQAQQDSTRARQPPPSPNRQPPPPAPTRQPSTPSRRRAAAQPETEEPPSPSSSTSSSQQPMEVEEAANPPTAPETASAPPSEASNGQITRALSESSASRSTPSEPKTMLHEASLSGNENADPKAKETPTEETMRVTRGRLKKSRSGGNR